MGLGGKALPRLREAWDNKIYGMRQMNQATEVQPRDSRLVFKTDTNGQAANSNAVRVECGPVVFKLCERANRRPDPRMYVAVEGWICLEENDNRDAPLRTTDFGTNVGYFCLRNGRLDHVYGVHYDMDERGHGHPVFHAQLGSMTKLFTEVQRRFRLGALVCDHVKPLIRNVRTPTAQMDFLSVVTQLCADHLMSAGLSAEEGDLTARAFSRVRSASDFLLGAAHRLAYLNGGRATRCYRSSHWYGT